MKLLIKTDNEYLKSLYTNHQHYNPGDSGLDLFCPEDIIIGPGETMKIDLQIQCEALHDNIENNNVSYYLYPRSSIIKTPLRLANSVGIIDAGYRGNIIACVDNIKNYEFKIEKGSRLFQICGPALEPIEIRVVNELSNSQRGSGGFGSTG
jgi:dUTP pyrophosphatase